VHFWESSETTIWISGINHEGISHKKQEIICCPNCGCELTLLKKVVVDKVREVLREAMKKGEIAKGVA
jgi:hypothetical protein